MTAETTRKRLLCIRPRLQPSAGPILINETEEWIDALSRHAEVKVVDTDFDLQGLCASYDPHLIVLAPANWTSCWYPEIQSPRCRPDIPRVLFMQCDPHDPLRTVTFRMAQRLGTEAVFVNGDAYLQHMPELRRGPVFYAPQFIDDELFKDYGLEKTIPISIFSSHLIPAFYKWRTELLANIHYVFPTLIYTHPGYVKDHKPPFAVQGEAYARLINQSFFSAADTTRLDYGVRKHLEIPAAGSVLLAPDSDALKSYGFIDRENCLLGSGPELFAKIDILARDPDEYRRVRQAGMALVRSRYTRRTWRAILDWLDCRMQLKPGQRVQQVGRYGPFRCMTPTPTSPHVLATPQRNSDMAEHLQAARSGLRPGGDLAAAEATLTEAMSWVGHIAEPVFLMAIVRLLRADPVNAALLLMRRVQGQAQIDPSLGIFDPSEAAWLLLVARLIDNRELEAVLRQQIVAIDHLALRRMVWLLDPDHTGSVEESGLLAWRAGDLASVHWLDDEDFGLWCGLVGRILGANHASAVAPVLAARLNIAAQAIP